VGTWGRQGVRRPRVLRVRKQGSGVRRTVGTGQLGVNPHRRYLEERRIDLGSKKRKKRARKPGSLAKKGWAGAGGVWRPRGGAMGWKIGELWGVRATCRAVGGREKKGAEKGIKGG